ncbi:GrpB family protein [Corticicoccus populi]|uniref:GrpB family protein n=1 Tax=Corticicoccus populi TaxID=1812821 RepID=A0ABW5WTH2_9STAP
MLGLPRGTVFLSEWTKEWAETFIIEKNKIESVFPDENIRVHHIGSTSVEGLKAKPILDIGMEINNFEDIKEYIQGLERIGYKNMGSSILPERYYFIKGEPRTHQIHLFEKGNSFLEEQITFRDILRKNNSIKERYELLKIKLVEAHAEDKHKYAEMKTGFIHDVLEKYEY